MHESLQPGLSGEFAFVVPPTKTVPHLYPESPEFQAMPEVFATGFILPSPATPAPSIAALIRGATTPQSLDGTLQYKQELLLFGKYS